MLKKNLWIINQYGSLISNGIGRHRYLSKELTLLGYNVSLITARWSHVTKDEYLAMSAPELEVFEDFKFLRIPVIKYKNAHDKIHVQLIRIERGPLFPLVGAMGIISRPLSGLIY